jgi:predicted DNA-binding transcriptional regulator YafY
MSLQEQALRLMKFVAEMRKNNYPNATSFAELLRQADLYENIHLACNTRTIMRDIDELRTKYKAPIEYDATNRGYYLLNPIWDLNLPIMSDDVLSMSMLSTRLASDFLPEPIKGKANSAMENALAGNSSKFFDDAMIESILCATGIKSAVDPEVFKKIFDAWRMHQVIELTYHKPNEAESPRHFEPHILAFRNGIWYTKGYEHGKKDVKVYAIQRISNVSFADDTFVSDKKLIEDTCKNGLFVYPRIGGIRLRCDASIAFYLREHQHVKQFKVEPQTDGSLIITLKPAFEHEVIRWILGEGGKIEVLNPPELRAKVAAAGKLIWERNQTVVASAAEKKAKESSTRTKNVSTKKSTNSKAGKSGRH